MAVKLLSTVNRYVGLSTDPKPTDCQNGSTFLESDTGDLYGYSVEGWDRKDAPITALLGNEYLLKELLGEAKKTNENLELLTEAVKN